MASLNFPTGASDGATYDFTDDQGNTISYVYVGDKGAWYVKAPAGSGDNAVGEAPKDGQDYVRNDGDWVVANYSDGASVVIDNTPPDLADSTEGDLYWDTDDGRLYIAYSDDDTDQWVPATPSIKGDKGDAGGVVAQVNADWDATSGVAQILNKPTIEAGGWVVPAGTRMIFDQATVPAGWTVATDRDDHALRVVNSGSGTTGGSVGFTTAFQNQTISIGFSGSASVNMPDINNNKTNNSVTQTNPADLNGSNSAVGLSINQVQSHNHVSYLGWGGDRMLAGASASGVSSSANNCSFSQSNRCTSAGSSGTHGHTWSAPGAQGQDGVDGHTHGFEVAGEVHKHSFSSSTASGSSSGSGSTSLDLRVKYTNVCIGIKS